MTWVLVGEKQTVLILIVWANIWLSSPVGENWNCMCLPCLYATFPQKTTIYPENELPASTTSGKPTLCDSLGNTSLRGAIFLFCSLQRTHASEQPVLAFSLAHWSFSVNRGWCLLLKGVNWWNSVTSKTSPCRNSEGCKVRSLSFSFCSHYLDYGFFFLPLLEHVGVTQSSFFFFFLLRVCDV